MINSKLGIDWEINVENRFKKRNLIVIKLDKKGSKNTRSIDFFVHNKTSYQNGFLCEVKSINSAGFDTEIKASISSGDNNFLDAISGESFENTKNIRKKNEYDYNYDGSVNKIERCLNEAVDQYNKSNLDNFKIDKKSKPFVIILCFDFVFFPDQVNFAQILQQFPAVTAILTINSKRSDVDFKIYNNKAPFQLSNYINNNKNKII